MKHAAWFLAAAAALASQSDEEKVSAMAHSFLKAMKEADAEKAADFMHPKSQAKMMARVLAGFEKATEAQRERYAKTLGFADWTELGKAPPRAFVVALLKNAKDLGEAGRQLMGAVEGMETSVVGALRKGDFIYVVFETTFPMNGEKHTAPSLIVAYKDGEAWKLAYRGETNIGK